MSTLTKELQQKAGCPLSKKQARAIIKQYFAQYSTIEAQQQLWLLTTGTLSTDQLPELQQGIHRHNILFFHEFTCLLLHAVQQLQQHHKRKK